MRENLGNSGLWPPHAHKGPSGSAQRLDDVQIVVEALTDHPLQLALEVLPHTSHGKLIMFTEMQNSVHPPQSHLPVLFGAIEKDRSLFFTNEGIDNAIAPSDHLRCLHKKLKTTREHPSLGQFDASIRVRCK